MISKANGSQFKRMSNHGSVFCFGTSSEGDRKDGNRAMIFPNGTKYEGYLKMENLKGIELWVRLMERSMRESSKKEIWKEKEL